MFATTTALLLFLAGSIQTASAFSPSSFTLSATTSRPARDWINTPTCLAATTASSPLDVDNNVFTAIIIFDVNNVDEQTDLVGKIQDFAELVRQEPGFISANLHKSLDGVKVANYAQWESKEDFDNFRANTTLQRRANFLAQDSDSRTYEIFAWQDKQEANGPVIHEGPIVHFAEFDMFSQDLQPTMVDLAKEHLGPAMKMDGLISACFHKSHDGMKVINYGQWENVQAIENLKKQPGFSTDTKPYWDDVAVNEHHLYELVSVVHKVQ